MDMTIAVGTDEFAQVRVQRQVAVIVQLADRDVQSVSGADLHDRIGSQPDQFADP
jgi:hypothetical protein